MNDATPNIARHPGYDEYPDWENWWLVGRFRDKYKHDIPTPGHLRAMAAIVDGLGSPWNISTNWDRCNWYASTRGAISLVVTSGRFASFDFDYLTRMVIAAHKHCVRVEIEARNMQKLLVTFWPRDRARTNQFDRHPTLDDLAERAIKAKS